MSEGDKKMKYKFLPAVRHKNLNEAEGDVRIMRGVYAVVVDNHFLVAYDTSVQCQKNISIAQKLLEYAQTTYPTAQLIYVDAIWYGFTVFESYGEEGFSGLGTRMHGTKDKPK